MRNARLFAALMSSFLCGMPMPASAAPHRWPSWPSEVERAATPLTSAERPEADRERTAALVRLQTYPTELILPILLQALDDPSAQVQRETLRVCYIRRIDACWDPATALYRRSTSLGLRAAALRVLALDPSGERLDLLLAALRDPSDSLRAEAAQLAGWAPLVGEARSRTRRALLAKLSDTASVVRQRAVTAIGLQGPGDGTLALTRLLEDPEPSVRAAAAVALGLLRDPRAINALRRAVDAENEGSSVRAMVDALARLPGEDAALALLGYLDEPPAGVGALSLAESIGDRAKPEPVLIDGLIERLRDPRLVQACGSALLWLGDAAGPALRRALERGLDPALEREVARLLAALAPPPAAKPTIRWPNAGDPQRWAARLSQGSASARFKAGAALGARAPAWLGDSIHAKVGRTSSIEPVRAWLVAWVAASQPIRFRSGIMSTWGILAGWALDRGLSRSDRCLSTLTLGSAVGKHQRALASAALESLAGDRDPPIRACAALASARLGAINIAQTFLLDDDDRVRAAAVLGLRRTAQLPASVKARIHHLGFADTSPQVRRAAQHPGVASADFGIVVEQAGPTPWVKPRRWLVANPEEAIPLWLPVLGSGTTIWTAGPGTQPDAKSRHRVVSR